VLFHRATWHDADLAQLDGVINLRPGQFLVTIFLMRSCSHIMEMKPCRYYEK
jgi:hypothetical protein